MGLIICIPLSCKNKPQTIVKPAWPSGLKSWFTWCGIPAMVSNSAGYIYLHFEFFVPSLFRTAQWSPCKWNQAWPVTCGHSCFRPQIRLIIQYLVYLYAALGWYISGFRIVFLRNEDTDIFHTLWYLIFTRYRPYSYHMLISFISTS